MDQNKEFIEKMWEKIEKYEQSTEILKALEVKKEENIELVAKNMFKVLGIRGLLNGIIDVIAISMIIVACVFFGIYIYLGFDVRYIYSMIFIFSPTLYACIFGLAYVKEKQLNTILVQMSCRYTFLYVMVFRMLLNSGLAVLFNFCYVFTLSSQFEMNIWKALALSFSSLMIFSVILLKSLEMRNKILGFAGVCVFWFCINLMIFSGMKELYSKVISEIPVSVLIIICISFSAFYLRKLTQMLGGNYKRRYLNA